MLKRFEQPDEIRMSEKPGWKWSVRVGRSVGAKTGAVEQVGMGALRAGQRRPWMMAG